MAQVTTNNSGEQMAGKGVNLAIADQTHNKEVGRYCIDFSVVEDGKPTHCNVSILGEKRHKSELPHDFARMRDLTKEGELMIPFTARQIFSDPSKCVSEVKSIFSKWRQALVSA